jgi:hypothetical protein
MGPNFDDYSGFQPKTTPVQGYATLFVSFQKKFTTKN